MKSPSVAVTGLGCICAAGKNLEQTMRSLYAGSRSPSPPARFQVELERTFPVFEIPEAAYLLPMPSEGEDRSLTTRLALIAAGEALESARIEAEKIKGLRVGVCLGSTVGCTLNNEPFYREYREKKRPGLEPIRQFLKDNPALHLAQNLGCNGPSALIANACSAGTDAVGLAKAWIEQGLCDIALAGGTDELCRITYLGFISLMVTSTEPCRPFDRNRTGLNLGEGAGILVLEHIDSAIKRGVPILAYVTGYGCSADAYHPTGPHPEGAGLRRAIHHALRQAGARPADVDFVNAHGTSTPDNDRVEGKVLADIFSPGIKVVSTKSYTGHTLGAAGGIEAALTVRGLMDQRIPATLGFEEQDLECGIIPTTDNCEIEAEMAMSDSLAFGGNNSVLIFQRGSR